MKTNRIKFCLTATFAVVIFLGVTTAANSQDIRMSNQVANVVDASLLGSDTNDVAITIQFMDLPLDRVLKSLIKQGHINVVLDPIDHTVHNAPLVSFHWENITIRQAIVALCKHYDLVIVKDSGTGVVRIKPKD
jgi:type II secretory pathway component HofQ